MSELALNTAEQPTRQAIEAKDRSAPLKVTGKLRVAIDAMVWLGARRHEAAEQAGLTDHSVRSALNKPHVKQYYLSQLEVLRTSERARNIHTLAEVRDQKTNQMARVNAVNSLERLATVDGPGAAARQPAGLMIVINSSAAHAPQAPNQVQVIDNTEDDR